MRLRHSLAFFLALWFSSLGAALAQDYPTRVVRLIVPYPPGGVVDITGRLLADELAREGRRYRELDGRFARQVVVRGLTS